MELANRHLTRQSDLIPAEVLGEHITIIGAGAIGSFVTLALAKMGFENLTVIDFDTVEIENMNSQMYPYDAIGKPKVVALKHMVSVFANVEIDARCEKYEKGMFKGIVISAVDSMAVRKLIWDNHKGMALATKLIIDPRMGAEQALCYVANPMSDKDISMYEKTLYSDENAVQERCTAKSTIYTVLAISSHVAKIVKDYATKSVPYTRILQWNIKDNAQECVAAK
jgi:molybdopterin/thiamine biosynthesis adenylyltransferase